MKIVIYQTSDLHGYIYPTNYVNDKPLGFLKIASYILNDENGIYYKKLYFSKKVKY